MILLPESVAEAERNLRWAIATRLQIIEEVVMAPRSPGPARPLWKKR